ncbi:MAG: serine protease [Bdellovibrionales bacterium]|nr:serine protease [Bdellovibrionales bacterium]
MESRHPFILAIPNTQDKSLGFRIGLYVLWVMSVLMLSACIYPTSYPPPYVLNSKQDSEENVQTERTYRRSFRRSGGSGGSSRNFSSSLIDQTVNEVNRLEDLEAEDYLDTVAYIYSLIGICNSPGSITAHKTCVENCVSSSNLQNCFSTCNATHSCAIESAFGSGTFMSETTVLTNHHVVEEAIASYTSGGKHYYNIFTSVENHSGDDALLTSVKWYDENDDVALIEISPSLDVDVPSFGSLSSLRLLDELFTIGSPIGMKWTASLGHLTNKNPEKVNDCENCIIYSIPTFSGSSGGPVFDSDGDLVAIHAFVLTSDPDEDASVRTQFRGGPHIDRIKELFDENKVTESHRSDMSEALEKYSVREQRNIADSIKDIVIQLNRN